MLQKYKLDRAFCFPLNSCLSHRMTCWVLRACLSRRGLRHESELLWCAYFTAGSINGLLIFFPCNISFYKISSEVFIVETIFKFFCVCAVISIKQFGELKDVKIFQGVFSPFLQREAKHSTMAREGPSLFHGAQVQSSLIKDQRNTQQSRCTFFSEKNQVCAMDTLVANYLLNNMV